MQDAGCRIPDAGYRMQDTGCRIPDAGYRMQDTGHKIQEGVDTMSSVCGSADTKQNIFLINSYRKNRKVFKSF